MQGKEKKKRDRKKRYSLERREQRDGFGFKFSSGKRGVGGKRERVIGGVRNINNKRKGFY